MTDTFKRMGSVVFSSFTEVEVKAKFASLLVKWRPGTNSSVCVGALMEYDAAKVCSNIKDM